MLKHARRQMRTSIARLVAAGLAIVLGTAFIAATILSTEVIEATARKVAAADLEGAQVVVESGSAMLDEAMRARIAEVPGVDRAQPVYTLPQLLDSGDQERYVELRNANPSLELAAGTQPTGVGVVVSTQLAERLGLQLGDALTLRNSATGPRAERQVQISGLVDAPLRASNEVVYASADLVLAQQRAMEWPDNIQRILVYSTADPATLTEPIRRAAVGNPANNWDAVVVRTAEDVTDIAVRDMVGSANTLMWFGLGFAALAIIVAGLVIANTFEVLVAQRTRTLAMLRCVGASKAQVRGSVLFEALVLGLVASLVGAVLGVVLGQAAVWFLETRNLGVAVPQIGDISPWVLIVPVLVGLGVTLVAASGPARAATRVSPVAAMRPTAVEPVRSGSQARLVISALLIVGGGAMLVFATAVSLFYRPDGFSSSTLVGLMLMIGILGGLVSLVGVLVGAVFVVPRVAKGLGRLLELVVPARSKATVRLATANAVRNPRRTATTTSALVIGVTLVVLMATGAASARASMNEMLGLNYSADVVAMSYDQQEMPEQVRREVAAVPGVTKVLPVSTELAMLTNPAEPALGGYGGVFSFDPAQADGVVHGTEKYRDLRPGEVIVSEQLARSFGWQDGQRMQLTKVVLDHEPGAVPTLDVTLRVVRSAPMTVVLPETLAKLTTPTITGVFVAVDGNVNLDGVVDGISQVVADNSDAGYAVFSPAQSRLSYERVIDALLAVVIGLLAVSVVIALVGIANTLSLSVIERRREHAVLRAVGVTKGQLRGTLAVEGVLLALTGAVVGIVLGLLYGWAGSAVLLGLTGAFTLGVAPGVMGGAVLIGLVAGLIASVVPANSAIRVPPVVALAAE